MNDLLPPDHEGGLELSAYEIGNELKKRGHDVQFVCSEWRSTYAGVREEQPNIHRILTCASVETPKSKVQAAKLLADRINIAGVNTPVLARFLEQQPPFDVALVFGVLRTGLATTRALTDRAVPIVWSIGDVALPTHFALPSQTRLYSAVFKTLARKWHAVEQTVDLSRMLFVSDFVRQRMIQAGINPRDQAVIPRGIDFDPVQRVGDRPPNILIACRLAPSRGVHIAIQALIDLHKRRPDLDWHLNVAGSGDAVYEESLKNRASALPERISFLGKLTKQEVLNQMRSARIFINPTVEVEGFGRINIEAMACGAALITADIPSVHEIVEDDVTALLFPPGDFQFLGHRIENLLTDPEKAETMADEAVQQVAKRFTMQQVIAQIETNLEL
jgi:glycosyltransferase involved in cell wall biosynthesis